MMVSFTSCSKETNTSGATKINVPNIKEKLPENFTIDKIKNALLEHINYSLWLNYYTPEDEETFYNYINKPINVEIRLYTNKNSVYTYVSELGCLISVKSNKGFIYCSDRYFKDPISGEYSWSIDENFEVLEKYSVILPEPHKPNYGSSEYKNSIISKMESFVKNDCKSFSEYDKDKWGNIDVYISDFFEYEDGVIVLLYHQDGSITYYPINVEENNGEILFTTAKSFTVNGMNDMNEYGQYEFERRKNDAVKHFKYSSID